MLALLDSEAGGNFIDGTLLKELGKPSVPCKPALQVTSIHGSALPQPITHITPPLQMQVGLLHHEEIQFLILPHAIHPVILGLPWLRLHAPSIDWPAGEISQWGTQCFEVCLTPVEPPPRIISALPGTLHPCEACLLEEYGDFSDVFDAREADSLPPHRPFDCPIDNSNNGVSKKFSGSRPKYLGNNTKLVEWLPQNDLLGHPHIKAFLSHGGLNSIFEAMYHGVPVVGMPLFGDHYDTMTRVQAKGMGIILHWKTITDDDIYEALVKVINDPSYRRQAQRLSEIHKDQPEHPVGRTVYWINYILRHGGAPHLRSAIYGIPFYQYFLLDVATVVLLGAVSATYILSRTMKFIFKRSEKLLPSSDHDILAADNYNGIANGIGKCSRNGPARNEKKLK
ncbi:2-hydroxyacylsphingosine 1-beta-galactosyltransferase-like [Microcaecilia unicolor]|uniref:UDP-glucuronosyltransferase n=1 Tax=Microcaecilia unicolor TaxID=1415580 RepID=A0A6P7WY03_9AMPH|nr:2-hydroxyacylsphingosine 1-beta-galactosyltransferase-like [Microcaecilia unicolor]